ncbi:hypothetical protein C8J57DRAFT_1299320 [Mycena rebaudengoi]|nr:hypothetical protein C8J57DRAFT_1299320 [Mycena rebaudengoi]
MSFQQAQAEGLCLRFPENFGLHRDLTMENAVMLLIRGTQSSVNVPYTWGFVDKPQEGQILLLFLPGQSPFPNDGIRYQQEAETKYTVPAGPNRELEVQEAKFGYVPGHDQAAWRTRRRFRLQKGGHPQLVLVHYSRNQPMPIIPGMADRPVRQYPLRTVNEPSVYVMGDKQGQKVYNPATGPPPPPGGMGGMPMGMNFTPQQLVAQQNSSMALLERRREQEQRARTGNATRQPRVEDEDSGDENDNISTRSLSLTRYRRNHDIMAEVFAHAAYGEKNPPPPRPAFSIFNKAELEAKTEKLKAEIEALQARGAERKSARSAKDREMAANHAAFEVGDVSMESLGEGMAV